jgi:hypothetical protein
MECPSQFSLDLVKATTWTFQMYDNIPVHSKTKYVLFMMRNEGGVKLVFTSSGILVWRVRMLGGEEVVGALSAIRLFGRLGMLSGCGVRGSSVAGIALCLQSTSMRAQPSMPRCAASAHARDSAPCFTHEAYMPTKRLNASTNQSNEPPLLET